MIKKKHYYYFYFVIIVFVAAVFTVGDKVNMKNTVAQIESNLTSTICINGKRVTATTICIINQPCHTVGSNSANVDKNDNQTYDSSNNNNNDAVTTTPFLSRNNLIQKEYEFDILPFHISDHFLCLNVKYYNVSVET